MQLDPSTLNDVSALKVRYYASIPYWNMESYSGETHQKVGKYFSYKRKS